MIKQFFVLIITFLPLIGLGQTTTINFDKDSDKITSLEKLKLDSIISEIKMFKSMEEISLTGHTDSDASTDYNNLLSFNRAKSVREYFIQNGLKNHIHITSRGESLPINKNETEQDKAKNRRVDILRNYSKNNFAFKIFDAESQLFIINPKKDTVISCKNGTSVVINTGIFQSNDSLSKITIRIKEFYNKKDFILSNLTTQDNNNNQLESRGMINIEATQNDKQLDLRSGKNIGVLFKDRVLYDSTETYQGKVQNQEISWVNNNDIDDWVTVTSHYDSIGKFLGEDRVYKNKSGTSAIMNDLLLKSNNLGWINCDRFYNSTVPKYDLIVEYAGNFVPNVVVVFDKINSVLPFSYREDTKLIFKNIPSNQEITIIGLFKDKEDEKILFGQKKTLSKEGLIEVVTFDKLTKDEIKQKINVL